MDKKYIIDTDVEYELKREISDELKNVFMSAVHFLWRIDTPTNVLPSLHVFNTLGCWIAIRRSEALRARRWVQLGVSVLSAAIILSTLFLKQHSFVDVSAAFLLAVALYYPAFCLPAAARCARPASNAARARRMQHPAVGKKI